MKTPKYHLYCTKCGAEIDNFGTWFSQRQKCNCGCSRAEVKYFTDYSRLKDLCTKENLSEGLFRYFDFLPLNDIKDAVTLGEGTVPLERWQFLEDLAKDKYGIDCKVVVTRSDLSGGTGTFKDPAGALAASLFKEFGIKEFCVASTGNTATAFSRYLSLIGTKCTVFSPSDVNPDTVEAVRSYGQTMNVSEGNYACSKKECADFSANHGVLTSAGNIDPIRVESKRTLVFEYLRQLGGMPDVYIQAVAGGTAPIALDKGVRELNEPQVKSVFDCAQLCGGKDVKLPRMVLVQQDLCDPMVQAWEKAVASGFPTGWENDYPSIAQPTTKISILSTGTPGMYPIVAPIVRKSGGSFVRVKEDSLVELAREVFDHKSIVPGPASMVCIAGFIQALEQGLIHSGETVSVNMGEGSGRASAFRNKVLADSENGK